MELRFTKMHGLGNDFVVIDGVSQSLPRSGPPLPVAQLRQLGDRHFGIGFDQLLLVEPASAPGVDFRYRIFNSDGSEVSQCGNGARCFARFVLDHRLTDKHRIRVETASGEMTLDVRDDGQVTVDMGAPRWRPEDIPLHAATEADTYTVSVDGQPVTLSAVSMGNPHCVLRVDNVDTAPVTTLGPRLESHPDFPERVNVGFMQVVDRAHIRLRVFERGAGETLACGSGACAAVVCGQRLGLLDDTVRVTLPGGDLEIRYRPGENAGVLMTGPAARVYDGTITLD